MRRQAAPDTVDRSRDGFLVHDAKGGGRDLMITTYIEGLQGDDSRRYMEERVICRTSEQSRTIAQLLRQARYAPDCSVDNRIAERCERGTRGCTIQHARFAHLEQLADPESWLDASLPEDAAIDAAFPTRSGRHDLYAEAMRLVGARRTKGALVALVNWLLLEREKAKEAPR